jgi:hypothetical protein
MFMVYLAIINVSLILFDLTYLWLRPQYFRLLPIVTDVYDPVKGIEPHPLTERYLVVADETDALLAAGVSPVELVPRLSELGELSAQIVTENPFERSGQTRSFIRLQVGVKDYLQREGTLASSARPSGEEVLELFWSLEPSPGLLPARSDFFQSDLRPLLAVNYHRAYDLDGELVDKFWMIDLPFLLIFAFEFGVRWYLSIRRSNLGNWFLFPILNWYDLLGIIPVKQMRLFRLFRIGSIYVRLKRSDHSTVGDDFVTRTVKYFTNIISEEISDMVALRILTGAQRGHPPADHSGRGRAPPRRPGGRAHPADPGDLYRPGDPGSGPGVSGRQSRAGGGERGGPAPDTTARCPPARAGDDHRPGALRLLCRHPGGDALLE